MLRNGESSTGLRQRMVVNFRKLFIEGIRSQTKFLLAWFIFYSRCVRRSYLVFGTGNSPSSREGIPSLITIRDHILVLEGKPSGTNRSLQLEGLAEILLLTFTSLEVNYFSATGQVNACTVCPIFQYSDRGEPCPSRSFRHLPLYCLLSLRQMSVISYSNTSNTTLLQDWQVSRAEAYKRER